MININQVKVRRMVAQDVELIAQAFAHMNKTREQYERYWQENVAVQRVTLIAELEGCIVGYTNIIWQSDYATFVHFCKQKLDVCSWVQANDKS